MGSCHAFVFTDEELRTGDPADTIRRASMMPGQLQHSLSSHRLSPLMASSGDTHSHRLSLMPGAPKTRLRSPKDTKRSSSLAPFLQTSPEVHIPPTQPTDTGSFAAAVNILRTAAALRPSFYN